METWTFDRGRLELSSSGDATAYEVLCTSLASFELKRTMYGMIQVESAERVIRGIARVSLDGMYTMSLPIAFRFFQDISSYLVCMVLSPLLARRITHKFPNAPTISLP